MRGFTPALQPSKALLLATDIDYRKLLKVYMAAVAFADEIGHDALTKMEWEALYEIECEVDRDNPHTMLRKSR